MFRLEKSSEPYSFQELPYGKEQTRGREEGRGDQIGGMGLGLTGNR